MVNCVALTYVAACATALKVTVELERKFEPLMVRAWAAAPAVTEDGDRLTMDGTALPALFTVKFMEFEAPPPGGGFVTTTAYEPDFA